MRQAQKAIVRELITNKIMSKFNPLHLEVVNESYKHKVPPGSETHFKIQIISKTFEKMSLVARHRLIYECLDDEIKGGVHALALDCRTEDQWKDEKGFTNPNIPCLGKSDLAKKHKL